jgi:sodium-type flagellar protein MotY
VKTNLFSIIACLIVSTSIYAELPFIHYQAPLGDERWRASGNRLRCGLSLPVPNYGVAYFEQYAAKNPHFIMTHWQQSKSRQKARVVAKPPQWKPFLRTRFITRTYLKPGKYGFFLRRNRALNVLTSLAVGYKARFSYKSELGYFVKVDLSPVRFQKAYSRYMKCVAKLLPFDFDMVRDTTVLFTEDSTVLNDKAYYQLEQVSLYVRVDSQVRKVKIAGYTDSLGRHGYNNAVSELRAKAVKQYLMRKGVAEGKISITWFGQKYPIASNVTSQGRKENRRVEIHLIK